MTSRNSFMSKSKVWFSLLWLLQNSLSLTKGLWTSTVAIKLSSTGKCTKYMQRPIFGLNEWMSLIAPTVQRPQLLNGMTWGPGTPNSIQIGQEICKALVQVHLSLRTVRLPVDFSDTRAPETADRRDCNTEVHANQKNGSAADARPQQKDRPTSFCSVCRHNKSSSGHTAACSLPFLSARNARTTVTSAVSFRTCL
jgi:hypothetical protein